MENQVRDLLSDIAEDIPPQGEVPPTLHWRARRRIATNVGATLVAVAALIFGSVVTVRSITESEPPRPAAPAPRPAPDVPKFHYVHGLNTLDLNTGEMSPLPMGDLGDWVVRNQFAASPDGSKLAYVSLTEDESHQIFIARIDGTGVARQMTHDPIDASSPAWSPDGTRITYLGHARREVGAYGIFVLDVATGEATRVIDAPIGEYTSPTFTPDGSSILYCDSANPSFPVLSIVPVAGGKSTVLFGRGRGGMADACNGSLSPDGSLVTMMGSEVGGSGANRFVANADGTELRLIPGGRSNPAGTWSPDGSRIVATTFNEPGAIIVVDIATGTASRVTEGSVAIWLDDHTLLVEV
jgi:dipeptidyl aminopeptidase/acylaminoacyl peptidase